MLVIFDRQVAVRRFAFAVFFLLALRFPELLALFVHNPRCNFLLAAFVPPLLLELALELPVFPLPLRTGSPWHGRSPSEFDLLAPISRLRGNSRADSYLEFVARASTLTTQRPYPGKSTGTGIAQLSNTIELNIAARDAHASRRANTGGFCFRRAMYTAIQEAGAATLAIKPRKQAMGKQTPNEILNQEGGGG